MSSAQATLVTLLALTGLASALGAAVVVLLASTYRQDCVAGCTAAWLTPIEILVVTGGVVGVVTAVATVTRHPRTSAPLALIAVVLWAVALIFWLSH